MTSKTSRTCTVVVEQRASTARSDVSVGQQWSVVVTPEQPVVIGRGDTADIRLMEPTISRLSLRLTLEEGQLILNDYSENGAIINGGRRWPTGHVLASGDRIELDPFVFRVTLT